MPIDPNPANPSPSNPTGLSPNAPPGVTNQMPIPASTLTQTPDSDPAAQRAALARQRRMIYYSCVGVCVAAPVIALAPPRKLDLYTFGLGVVFCVSAGQVVQQRTGQGLLWHIGTRLPGVRHQGGDVDGMGEGREVAAQRQKPRGLVKRMWMGDEPDDWVEKRKMREREALEEGKGYGGLIAEQVKEVWGAKDEEGKDE